MTKKQLLLVTLLTLPLWELAVGDKQPLLTIIRKSASSQYIVHYSGAKSGTLILTVHNLEGHLMIRRTLRRHQGNSVNLDFMPLAEGQYKVNIRDGVLSQMVRVDYYKNTSAMYASNK